jgi:hypothetical protein
MTPEHDEHEHDETAPQRNISAKENFTAFDARLKQIREAVNDGGGKTLLTLRLAKLVQDRLSEEDLALVSRAYAHMKATNLATTMNVDDRKRLAVLHEKVGYEAEKLHQLLLADVRTEERRRGVVTAEAVGPGGNPPSRQLEI